MSNYKWYILILAAATHAVVCGAERMCLPPLFTEILSDLEMSKTQMGTIWGMDPLAGVFVSLGAGLLIDRFGLKWTLATACFLAGLTGAARGLSTGFVSMTATMFAFGLLAAMMPTLLPKAVAVWFFERQLALANGILTLGMYGGSMIGASISATILSPLLGGWSNVLFLYGLPPVLLSIMWWATGKEPVQMGGEAAEVSKVPFQKALRQVICVKGIWGIGIVFLGAYGAFMGLSGYLPMYLRDIGWTPSAADSALTTVIGTTAVSAIPMAVLSDRLDSRKKVLAPSLFVAAIFIGILPLFDGPVVWGLLIIGGLLRGCMFPLSIALVVEQEGIGAKYAGTAVGMATGLGMLGAFFSQPLGMSVSQAYGGGAAFFVWSALSVITLTGFLLVKETARKAGNKPV